MSSLITSCFRCTTGFRMGNYLCVKLCPLGIGTNSRFYGYDTQSDIDASILCSEAEIIDTTPIAIDPVPEVAIVCQNAPAKFANLRNTASTPSSKANNTTISDQSCRKYVNFPFLTNDELAAWIINTRFMFILRGPPGSGKSYIADCIQTRFPSAKICSADNFWFLASNGAEYQFDSTRLSEAHEWCQTNAYQAAVSGASPLVIDNTNVRAWETRYYTDLARRFDYTVIILIPQTPWRFDPEALAMRNQHFVGLETVEAKVRMFEHVFPLYFGWLWPGQASEAGSTARHSSRSQTSSTTAVSADHVSRDLWPLGETERLLEWGWEALKSLVSLPGICQEFIHALGLWRNASVDDVLHHWMSATVPAFGCGLQTSRSSTRLHITSKFASFGRARGAERYSLSGAVTESLMGRLFTIQVTGLVVSSRTVGARIRLPTDDIVLRHLWAGEDQAILRSSESNCSQNEQNGWTDGTQTAPADRLRPIGCRAHVTLALAADVSAVETGTDLLRVVDAELNLQPGEHVAAVKGGSVRRVTVARPVQPGYGRFNPANPQFNESATEFMYVLDLDFPQHYRVLFAGAY